MLQFLEKNVHRPSVADDVVHYHKEDMLRRVAAIKRGANHAFMGQIEWFFRLTAHEPGESRFAIAGRSVFETDQGKRDRPWRKDFLARSAILRGEARPKTFMAAKKSGKTFLQGRNVQGASQAQSGGNIVSRAIRFQLVYKPQPLLRKGKRGNPIGVAPRDAADRGAFPKSGAQTLFQQTTFGW